MSDYDDEDETPLTPAELERKRTERALRRRSVRLGQALGLDGVIRVESNGSATIELPASAVARILEAYEATHTPIARLLP